MHKLAPQKDLREGLDVSKGKTQNSHDSWLSKPYPNESKAPKLLFCLCPIFPFFSWKPKRIKLLSWSFIVDINFIMARFVFYMIHNPCRFCNKAFNFSSCIIINFLLHSRHHAMYIYSHSRFKSDSLLHTAFCYVNS